MCKEQYTHRGMPKYFTDSSMSKEVNVNDLRFRVQLNDALLTKKYGTECPLCPEQIDRKHSFDHEGYVWTPNKHPISMNHVVIVDNVHKPQEYSREMLEQLADFAFEAQPYFVFYNGPDCGATIRDHFHFQAVEKLPLSNFPTANNQYINHPAKAFHWSGSRDDVIENIDKIVMTGIENGVWDEPQVNIILRYNDTSSKGMFYGDVFLRSKHKPDFYYENNYDVAPATFEMAGIINTKSRTTFNNINKEIIIKILTDVCISDSEYNIMKRAVGIQ